jgi:2',3'-cyclic-nucleotide 2'-phosphodiesterase/3'-nucleotidase
MRTLSIALSLFILLFISVSCASPQREVAIKLVQTSDIHGNYFPYDYMKDTPSSGSFARIYSYLQAQRAEYGDNLLLFENGDLLQGQPSAYYYNFIDTLSTHLAAEMLNFMKFDAANLGNHDIETGRAVFERWASDCNFPVLGANIIDVSTEKPFFEPYAVYERDGVKIAVLGMITPAIPIWLAESLWQGLRFDDMETTARHWMEVIRKKEKPDVIVGLFHAGQNAHTLGDTYRENASVEVAVNVPGFDVVLMGHDHMLESRKVANVQGDSVLLLNPANLGNYVAEVELTIVKKGKKLIDKTINGRVVSMDDFEVSQVFMDEFKEEESIVSEFVSKKIGNISQTITTRDAYFGSSAFVDLIHSLQLAISGAQISLAAPLSFDASIAQGDITVGDMFNLYKYENMLYTMRLQGKELKNLLEMSYALWTNQMTSPTDHLLFIRKDIYKGKTRYRFQNSSFNYDSAAGIIYTVDVTKSEGEKVTIYRLADGTPFDEEAYYTVAMNSYRGNGGGELITKGAGLSKDELQSRMLAATTKDLRYYLMEYIQEHQHINPRALNQWKFIPEDWTKEAAKRDYKLLFNE